MASTKRSIVKRMLNCVADFPPGDKLVMGPTNEDRNTVQIYFCELCNGPGTCFVKATNQTLCLDCLKNRTLILKGSKHYLECDAKGVPHLILKAKRKRVSLTGERGGKSAACPVCEVIQWLTKHHSYPSVNGSRPRGPVYWLCRKCHDKLHKKFTNEQLHDMPIAKALQSIR